MRPIRRNSSPITGDYSDYKDAKTELVSRIGSYCSYCERRIPTNLAVEHIEPKKGAFGQPHLEGRWSNFLLACVNCNSTKSDKQVILNNLLLPDRDNTFYAFNYTADGLVEPSHVLNVLNSTRANATLTLVGLDKTLQRTVDEKDKQIALDRMSQRVEVWGIAESALNDYNSASTVQAVKNQIVENMLANGFFSIWMNVFENITDMQNLFIDAMAGTRESDCFHPTTVACISPHPNIDGLAYGSKI